MGLVTNTSMILGEVVLAFAVFLFMMYNMRDLVYSKIMLQKIVNGIAIASGVVSLTVIGLGGYVFIRKDAIIENVKGKIIEAVMPGGLGDLVVVHLKV